MRARKLDVLRNYYVFKNKYIYIYLLFREGRCHNTVPFITLNIIVKGLVSISNIAGHACAVKGCFREPFCIGTFVTMLK